MSEVFDDFGGDIQFHHTLKDGNGALHILKILAFDEMPPTLTVKARLERNAGGARNPEQFQEETMTVTTSDGVVWVIETDIKAPFNETPYRLTHPEKEWVKTSVKQDLDRREQGQFSCPTVSCYTSDADGNSRIVLSQDDTHSGHAPDNSFSRRDDVQTFQQWD